MFVDLSRELDSAARICQCQRLSTHDRMGVWKLVVQCVSDAADSARSRSTIAWALTWSPVRAICGETLPECSTAHLFYQCLFDRPEARHLVDARDAFNQGPR